MSVRVSVKVNTMPFRRFMTDLAQKQMPFAVAKALTDTASDVAKALKLEVMDVFDIKAPGLLRQLNPRAGRGMVVMARKSDGLVRMKSIVGFPRRSKSGALMPRFDRHVTGAIVTPYNSKLEAIPLRAVSRTGGGKIRKNHQPRNLMMQKNVSIVEIDGDKFIVRRTRRKTTYFYLLVPRHAVRAKLGFKPIVQTVVTARLQRNFNRNMVKAMRTAKRR